MDCLFKNPSSLKRILPTQLNLCLFSHSIPLLEDFWVGASSSESESAKAKRSMNFFFWDSVHICRTCCSDDWMLRCNVSVEIKILSCRIIELFRLQCQHLKFFLARERKTLLITYCSEPYTLISKLVLLKSSMCCPFAFLPQWLLLATSQFMVKSFFNSISIFNSESANKMQLFKVLPD